MILKSLCSTKSLTRSLFLHNMSHNQRVDLSSMRKPYKPKEEVLIEDQLPSRNPLTLFHTWFQMVREEGSVYEPNAVCLATSDNNGHPSARMVLLKSYGNEGFDIFTNKQSRKGREMTENPHAALLFYWDVFKRQVRIEGRVSPLSEAEGIEYFKQRPRGSQISASISHQSQVVQNRDVLVQRFQEMDQNFPGEIPKPDFWGGFRIIPDRFEFWQGQSNRLHDRIRFRRRETNEIVDKNMMGDEDWVIERLQP